MGRGGMRKPPRRLSSWLLLLAVAGVAYHVSESFCTFTRSLPKPRDLRLQATPDVVALPPPTGTKWLSMSTEQVLKSRSAKGVVILMIATGGYSVFLANMACRLRSLGLDNFVMVALDEEAWELCERKNYPAVNASTLAEALPVDAYPTEAAFHSAAFKSIAKVKQRAVSKGLALGLDVVLTDVDIAWLKDPMPYFDSQEVEGYDFVVQSDAFAWLAPLHELNSGFYFVRHGHRAAQALQRVIEIATENPTTREQTSFHEGLCGRPGILTHLLWRKRCVTTSGAKVVVLDRRKFPNGHNYFVDWSPSKVLAADPYIIHFNWLNGADTKLAKMKEAGMWMVADNGECAQGQTASVGGGGVDVCEGRWGGVAVVFTLLTRVLFWRLTKKFKGKKKVSFRHNSARNNLSSFR